MSIFQKSPGLSDKTRLLLIVALMAIVGVAVAGVSIVTLYLVSLDVEKARLVGLAHAQAHILEAVAEFDRQVSAGDHPERSKRDTISQVRDAFEHQEGYGESGEFVLAERVGEEIFFLASRQRANSESDHTVPWASDLAEPMRRALLGETGIITALDYAGVTVIAAYESVDILNLGFVAKINLAEVRKPFIKAAMLSAVGGVFILLVGAVLFRVISAPILLREEAEARYRLLLESTAEAIYGIDLDGNCTFVNPACIEMLGYRDQSDLLGKNMHEMIHHTRADGTNYPMEECKIYLAFREGGRSHVDDEVLWRADGSSFPTEYWSHPIVRDGKVAGSVVTFLDITARRRAEESARREKARLSGILDLAMEAVVSVGDDQRIQIFNGGAEVIFGYTAKEAVGQPIEMLLPERSRGNHQEQLSAFENSARRRRMGSARSEITGLRKDGSEFPAEASISRIEVGGERLFTATLRDLTAEKEAEAALRESEASLANAQRIAHIGSWEWDILNDKISWSDENFRIFNLVPQETMPTYESFTVFVHPDDREGVDAAVTAALDDDEPYRIDHRITLANGEIRVLRERAEVYRDDLGKPVRMAGTVQDITEQKHAEEIARREKAQAEEYLNIAGSMIMALDGDGRITLMNESARKTLEYETEEVIGKKWLETFAPEEERDRRYRWYRDWLASGGQEIDANEVTVKTRTGKNLFTRWHNRPIRDEAGNTIGVLCSGEDITVQRQTELQLRQAQKMEAVGQLTSGIAHDFNNILAVVLGNLEFAGERFAEGKTIEKQLDLALQAAERGADLNRRLLAFSRNQVLESRSVNIGDVIESMADLLERALGEKIELVTHLDPDLPKVLLDPAQLESAILNLAINARDALPDGGVVGINAAVANVSRQSVAGDKICVTVWDTGIGMTEEVRERAMEPFFTTKGVGQGSGLGLSMVYGFAEQSGGKMEIMSEPDGGTIVEIMLPIDLAESAVNEEADVSHEISVENKSFTILVVEDQLDVRDVVVANLETLGYGVRVADEGKEALSILEQHEDIDLLLSDMVMPGMSGEEVVIAARAQNPDLRCIFMSGFAEKGNEGCISSSTEIRIIRKPFSRATLAQSIQECLAEG